MTPRAPSSRSQLSSVTDQEANSLVPEYDSSAARYFCDAERRYSKMLQTERMIQRIMESRASEIYSGSAAIRQLAGNDHLRALPGERFDISDIRSHAIARINSIQATSPLRGNSIASLIAERSRIIFPSHIREWLPLEALRRAMELQDLLPENLWELEEDQW
ncbi:hypothetical protein ABZ896_27280 [Streptomyces sp. NPDC047072]|uniref:hypothetical protein n=1 Tax=Streptomyces sp. NPDC047072 TaxID=3154809 RepID=UPI0033F96136